LRSPSNRCNIRVTGDITESSTCWDDVDDDATDGDAFIIDDARDEPPLLAAANNILAAVIKRSTRSLSIGASSIG
jgi:hypothetical protein